MNDVGHQRRFSTAQPAVAILAIGVAVGTRPFPLVAVTAAFIGGVLLLTGRDRRPGVVEVLLLGTLLGAAISGIVTMPWHLGLLGGALGAVVFAPRGVREQLRAWWGVPRWTRAAVALVIVSTVAGCVVVTWDIASRDGFFFPVVTDRTLLALAALANAASEELVWRGAAVALLLSRGASPTLTLLVSSASFGLAHFANGVPEGLLALPTAGAYGIAMCLLAWTSRSLWLPLASHAVVDVAVVAALAGWTL